MAHRTIKRYGHERGFSCAFRQWRALHSHCHFIHGYALAFTFVFEGPLDERGWVVDFGGLKALEAWLRTTFDHTTAIAADDPELALFKEMADRGLIDLRVFEHGVGIERFAEYAAIAANAALERCLPQVRCIEVTVSEHGSNSAAWTDR